MNKRKPQLYEFTFSFNYVTRIDLHTDIDIQSVLLNVIILSAAQSVVER